MPTLAELQNRTSSLRTAVMRKPKEEALVPDRRSQLRPSSMVTQKLSHLLRKGKS
jgi:hypothetical protein